MLTKTLACMIVGLFLAGVLIQFADAPAWGAAGFGTLAYLVTAHGLDD